jgi:predicted  nucleic acid-binding Zn-ribbon protein
LIHTYKINPGYFFYENVNLFADETTNNFEANDNALQVNQNKGNVGNIIHTVNGDIKGSIAKAEKILNDLPPECRKTKCDRMFRDMKKEITYLKKKFEEKETQLLTALKELKAINREAHDVKNKYIGLNDKHMELSEKYTKLLESKSK